MRIEQLSDHAGTMFEAATRELDLAVATERTAEVDLARAEAELLAARAARSSWQRLLLRSTPEIEAAGHAVDIAKTRRREAALRTSDRAIDTRRHRAGVEGERRFATLLSTGLSDEWFAFAGYRNDRGEADVVLIGPPGVWVVEVKNVNIRLHIDGGRWWSERVDRYGNARAATRAPDRQGRSWGRQVADIAESLDGWLARNRRRVPMRTAVVLVHPRAAVVVERGEGTDAVVTADPAELVRAIAAGGTAVDRTARDAIVDLVRRDHRHHERRRQRQR